MAHYKDLTPYEYFIDGGELNVGWLDKDQPFDKEQPSPELTNALEAYAKGPKTAQTRGWHDCPFCNERHTSSNEIRVFGEKNVFASPTLVIHYIRDHHYKPPQEFIDAVLNGPKPGTDEYDEATKKLHERMARKYT